MSTTITFDHQTGIRVVQVGAPKESALRVMEIDLDLWPWQSTFDQEPSKSRLKR